MDYSHALFSVSIPYGTIKSRNCVPSASESHVSIPYGTIKRACGRRTSTSRRTFQFHMVRLKGRRAGTRCSSASVSIPYGTIKSPAGGVRRISHNGVSIPYGTIKSVDIPAILYILQLFQFHMVRLKVIQRRNNFRVSTFQFHMVRLKVNGGKVWHAGNEFQFHMVRLKVAQRHNEANTYRVSIPYGTIKRTV